MRFPSLCCVSLGLALSFVTACGDDASTDQPGGAAAAAAGASGAQGGSSQAGGASAGKAGAQSSAGKSGAMGGSSQGGGGASQGGKAQGGGQAGQAQAGMGQGGEAQGGAAQGGQAQAGMAQGGEAQGGNAQAGAGQGGEAQGGQGQAGMAQGGQAQAGMGQGGEAQGGQAQAGMGQGGEAQGGAAQGGQAQGGQAQGGQAQGGQAQGGQATSCLGQELLSSLGKDAVLIGFSGEDSTADAAPFDGRYLYLAGGVFDGDQPCSSCLSCTAAGSSCANSGPGCGWWGCWQWDQEPPGRYVRNLVDGAKGRGQIPMITYYEILHTSGVQEGPAGEMGAANDASVMKRLLADFRFVAQTVGQDVAFLHFEPDFWGYAQHFDADPHATPAAVASAIPDECGDLEDTIAGLGRCVVRIAHKYAPNAKVGLHASGWGTKIDVFMNTDASFDVAGEAQKLADFLVAAGAAEGDFIVADMSDRDAQYYQDVIGQDRWFDDTNATLPNFTQAFAWSKALAERMGKPVIWWQLPVGNMSLAGGANHYRDNRVDYLMTHTAEVAASHGVGLFFGAGQGDQTTPETDGGNLIARTKAHVQAGGSKVCGP